MGRGHHKHKSKNPLYNFGMGKKLGLTSKKAGMIKLPRIIKSWD